MKPRACEVHTENCAITQRCWPLRKPPMMTPRTASEFLALATLCSQVPFCLYWFSLCYLHNPLCPLLATALLSRPPSLVACWLGRKSLWAWDVRIQEARALQNRQRGLIVLLFSVVYLHVSWPFCIKLQYSLWSVFHMECIFKCKLFSYSLSLPLSPSFSLSISCLCLFSLLGFKHLPLSRKELCSFNQLVMANSRFYV